MKKAKFVCKSVEVLCAYCGETIEDPKNNSLFWTVDEVRDNASACCSHCGRENRILLPKRIDG